MRRILSDIWCIERRVTHIWLRSLEPRASADLRRTMREQGARFQETLPSELQHLRRF